MLRRLAARFLGAAALIVAADGCSSGMVESQAPAPLRGSSSSVAYSCATPEGELLGSARFIGRDTVLVYMTTYDAASLAVVRRVLELLHTRSPKFNAVLVVLEPPQNAAIASVYRDSIPVRLDTCLADQETLDGRGPFGDMRAVPGLVLLDRDSRIAYRGFGIEGFRQVEQLLQDTGKTRAR